MSKDTAGNKWLFGFLMGAGLGLAAAVLLDPRIRARLGALLIEGTYGVADRLAALGQEPDIVQERREKRAGRTLGRKMDKLRAAGL